jgi:hypothetical protein
MHGVLQPRLDMDLDCQALRRVLYEVAREGVLSKKD